MMNSGATASDADVEASCSSKRTIRLSELGQELGFRRCHVLISLAACALNAGTSAVICSGPYVQQEYIKQAGIAEATGSFFTTSIIFGSIFGVFAWGGISDRLGRRNSLLTCIIATLVLTSCQLLIPEGRSGFIPLMALRAGIGVFYGGLMLIVLNFVAETAGDRYRGSLMAASGVGYNVGSVYTILWLMQARQRKLSWRVSISCTSMVPCILAIGLLWLCDETPRWLLITGQKARAEKVLNRIFASSPVMGEALVGRAPEIALDVAGSTEERDLLKDMQHLSVLPPVTPSSRFSLIPAFVAKANNNAVVNKTNMVSMPAPHQRFLNHTALQ